MRFYETEVTLAGKTKEVKEETERAGNLRRKTEAAEYNRITADFNSNNIKINGCAFVTKADDNKIIFSTCVINPRLNPDEFIEEFVNALCKIQNGINTNEVYLNPFFFSLKSAQSNGYIESDEEISKMLNFFPLYTANGRRSIYSDKLIQEDKSFEDIRVDIQENSLSRGYTEEIERISSGKTIDKLVCHPVHYFIQSKNCENGQLMINDLLIALYNKGRILSKRYTSIDTGNPRLDETVLENIYTINDGTTVLINIDEIQDTETNFIFGGMELSEICRVANNHSSRTLTIFATKDCPPSVKETILNSIGEMPLVEINEDTFSKIAAVDLLKKLAQRDDVKVSDGLVERLMQSEKDYDYEEINSIYSKWYHNQVVCDIFPEYGKYFVVKKTEDEEKIASPYYELSNMIGLHEVKKIINDAIKYYSLQKEYKLRGIKCSSPTMHMVFTGSPGTAKTSVARLFARILKENGILSGGKFFEVGRADLVGKYVGWTAKAVKKAFDNARGGVLFIDEAYSLVDGHDGSYGDEAINTIVQEMENCRKDTIVIFAGYKDEMQKFLNKNPGMHSRIAFHIDFKDYTDQELLDIARVLANKMSLKIDESAEEKLLQTFADARKDKCFGNGRFVRNLLDKSKIQLAGRLMKTDLQCLSDEELVTLKPEDIVLEKPQAKSIPRIGFY
jgi:AAA+ superfamily predicted ATPase